MTIHPSILELRKMAELNMEPKCFQVYLHLIEPGIKEITKNYLKGWQNIETYVNFMTMRHRGVFKTNFCVDSIENSKEETYKNLIDIDEFKKIKNQSFYGKIIYLKDNSVISKTIFDILDILREKRNKIHEQDGFFDEKTLYEFDWAFGIVFHLHAALEHPEDKQNCKIMKNYAEQTAINLLKMMNGS